MTTGKLYELTFLSGKRAVITQNQVDFIEKVHPQRIIKVPGKDAYKQVDARKTRRGIFVCRGEII